MKECTDQINIENGLWMSMPLEALPIGYKSNLQVYNTLCDVIPSMGSNKFYLKIEVHSESGVMTTWRFTKILVNSFHVPFVLFVILIRLGPKTKQIYEFFCCNFFWMNMQNRPFRHGNNFTVNQKYYENRAEGLLEYTHLAHARHNQHTKHTISNRAHTKKNVALLIFTDVAGARYIEWHRLSARSILRITFIILCLFVYLFVYLLIKSAKTNNCVCLRSVCPWRCGGRTEHK